MDARTFELERLSRRINWLVRFRRPIAVALAALSALVLMHRYAGWFPTYWPGAHIVAITFVVATFLWYGIETVLGFVLALWETNYWGLARSPSLPSARLLRRK